MLRSSHYVGNAMYRVRQIPFFGKSFKKTTEYFLKFLFYLKLQSFRLIMKNNFIQMADSAGHGVAYTIGTIFKHIIDCVPLSTPQIIVQRCQIADPILQLIMQSAKTGLKTSSIASAV